MIDKNGFVNLAQFAKIMGVPESSIRLAIKKGKLKSKMEGRYRMIHVKEGKQSWKLNINKSASEKAKKLKGSKKKKAAQKNAYDNPVVFEGKSLADAELQEKYYKAQTAQLKFQEQAGKLVEVDKIKRQAFETARKVRDAVMSIPGRLSHELAAETDPHKLEVKLTKELTNALERLIGVNK